MKHYSLTGRLIAIVMGCQLLLTASLTIVSVVYFRTQLRGAFDAALVGRATSTLALVRYDESSPPGLLFDASLLPPASDPAHQDLFEIRGPDGRVIARSAGVDGLPAGVTEGTTPYTDFAIAGAPYRAVTLLNVGVLDDEETVQVPARVTVVYAAPLVETYRHLTEVAASVVGSGLLLLALASALAFWGVHRGLEPLHALAEQAGAISVRNWDFRPPADAAGAKELAPLTGAIETVLHGLKEAFRQQRDFTSDAAHELKTCVAILKSTLQSLRQRPRPEEEYRAGLDSLLEDCARLEDLLERMLRLARIEQWAETGVPRQFEATELTSTCEAAISRIQALADSGNIAVELVNTGPVRLHADPEDLELIWVNLLENAVRYSPPGSKVVLRIHRQNGNGSATVTVEDSGPGIPPEQLPRVFERFRRGDPSRSRSTGGFGLGLAICKALVIAYGGEIEATNRAGCGTEMRVSIPVESS
jgi:signal transduction histidine kinase